MKQSGDNNHRNNNKISSYYKGQQDATKDTIANMTELGLNSHKSRQIFGTNPSD